MRIFLLAALSLTSIISLQAQDNTGSSVDPETGNAGIQWRSLFTQSFEFLALEHGFRYATDPSVRSTGLPELRGYSDAVSNLHGWADGDPFMVNYVGHPIQGSISGFIFVQNDPKYKDALFGRNRRYWKSRLRAAAFAWAYSEEFEIGLISEASIGHTQAAYPQQGFVDQVITPTVGLGWMVAEDAVDRMVVTRLESHVHNTMFRIMARGVLNPSRSMANMMAGRVPWYREGRSIFMSKDDVSMIEPRDEHRGRYDAIPSFEFTTSFRAEQVPGAGSMGVCVGGSGEAAFRIQPGLDLVSDIGGCKLMSAPASPGHQVTGDSLHFLIGPRHVWRQTKRWQPYAQVLAGGRKMTWESVDVAKRTIVEANGKKNPADQWEFTQAYDKVSPVISAAAGLNFRATSAIGIRVGEFGYTRAWYSNFDGVDFSNTVEVTTGLTLRWGTW